MQFLEELVTSRKNWLNDVLRPWCQQASRKELLKAEAEWVDVAGKVNPDTTLWLWAWSRFPELVHENLGIEETSEVEVRLRDGRILSVFRMLAAVSGENLYYQGAKSLMTFRRQKWDPSRSTR